jgi:FixJ family two-component response regulator
MLTGADDRKIAVEAMKLGASDFIVKSQETYNNLPSITQKIIQE